MYVAKEYDERKAEFLATATQLFMQHGYEQTSVNAIIEAVGVSKGAFYHYFKTKEDLLDELALQAGEQALAVAKPVVEDDRLSAIEKLNGVFAATNSFKAANRDLLMAIAQVFYSDSNVLFRTRLSNRSVETMSPLIGRIIRQGNREGSMDVRFPADTARFLLRIGADMVSEALRSAQEEGGTSRVLHVLEVYTESVERILGVEPGKLTLVDESMVRLLEGEQHD